LPVARSLSPNKVSSLLLILLSAVLVSHFALTSVPALKPFAGRDGYDAAQGLGLAVFACTALIAPLAHLLRHQVLLPLELLYLQPLLFVVLIMLIAQATRLLFEKRTHWQPRGSALFALLVGNSAILGTALLVPTRSDFLASLGLGFGVGAGFALLLLCFATLQARLNHAAIAVVFRGAPLALITTGIMALALMGFTGLIAE
jgi:electron transport complex protein RnfA